MEPEVICEALAGFDAADNAYRAAITPAQRLTGSDYPQFRRRLWSHLQRRGFDHSVISDVVARLWQELADPQHGVIDSETQEHQGENSESVGIDGPTDQEGEHDGTAGDPCQTLSPFAVD